MSSPPPFPSDDEKDVQAEKAEEPEELFSIPAEAVDEPPAKDMQNIDLNAGGEKAQETTSAAAPAADDDDDGDLFADASPPAEKAAEVEKPEPVSPSSTATAPDEAEETLQASVPDPADADAQPAAATAADVIFNP